MVASGSMRGTTFLTIVKKHKVKWYGHLSVHQVWPKTNKKTFAKHGESGKKTRQTEEEVRRPVSTNILAHFCTPVSLHNKHVLLWCLGSGQVLWTCTGRNKTLPASTSLLAIGETAGVNKASLGGYLHSSKKRARWAEGFHDELNGHLFDL